MIIVHISYRTVRFDLVNEQEPLLEGLSSLEEVIESFYHLCFVANMEYPKVNTIF